jgi:arsenite-transporting ATPase
MESNDNEPFKFEETIQNILDQETLKWIFVGGKGGVGKTTISASLSTLLAKRGKKVLIISTDPAHNLSDAFNQKIGKEPTQIKGFENLYGLELDPEKDMNNIDKLNEILHVEEKSKMDGFLQTMENSFPGIDEANNLKYIASLLDNKDYDIVVFDTAPTGHTLKLLEMPIVIGKSMEKLLELKLQFSPVIDSMGGVLGPEIDQKLNKFFTNMNNLKDFMTKVSERFKDAEKTTFIAVCIPEFLSVYETERLVESLFKENIDIRNVVINQVLMCDNPDKCKMCRSRVKMQKKYLEKIEEMFEDFHIIKVPLQKNEIRGTKTIEEFGNFLIKKNK